MSTIWFSSIGKKLIMSLSGLFLILFLVVHLIANIFYFGGEEAYNAMCLFMDTNPIVLIMVPVLALGFIVHIAWASWITLANRAARPVRYKKLDAPEISTWSSRNMYALGIIVLGGLIWHLTDFWVYMQLPHLIGGEAVANPYALVVETFSNPLIVILYIIWIVALWYHLNHGFWAAFQTVGFNNQTWIERWKIVAMIYAFIIAAGFISIPVAVLLSNCCK